MERHVAARAPRFLTALLGSTLRTLKVFWARGKFDHDKDRNLQFRGAVSIGGSPLDFLLFLQYLCAV